MPHQHGNIQGMIIFNHQYYDKKYFYRHERTETTCNHNRVRERMIEPNEMRLKDPRVVFDFKPLYAIQNLFISRPTRDNLVEFVKNRIPEITAEQINECVPNEDNRLTNTAEFINLIKTMAHLREVNSDAYTRCIQNLQRSTASHSLSTSNIQITSLISQQSTS